MLQRISSPEERKSNYVEICIFLSNHLSPGENLFCFLSCWLHPTTMCIGYDIKVVRCCPGQDDYNATMIACPGRVDEAFQLDSPL